MGSDLFPFSYWHKVQLEYVQSRIFLGNPGVWDYWVASKICATQYPLNVQFRTRYSHLWTLGWHLMHGRRNLATLSMQFSDYISKWSSCPKLWGGDASTYKRLAEASNNLYLLTGSEIDYEKAQSANMASNERREQLVDDNLEQVSLFIKHTKCSEEKAWNLPIGKLVWYNTAFLITEGVNVEVWTPKDEIAYQAHLKVRAEKIHVIAVEIKAENPEYSDELCEAMAAVQYWEKVIQDKKMRGGR